MAKRRALSRNKKHSEKQLEKLRRENTFLFASSIILFIMFLIAVIAPLNFQFNLGEQTAKNTSNISSKQPAGEHKNLTIQVPSIPVGLNEGTILMKVPAVDKDGNGVVTILAVEAEKGNGKTLMDINSLLFFTDTQESILTAKKVSSDITGLNLNNYDITYTIYAEANSIGGPSAGAALTIATIAALEKLKLRDDVMVTGRILPDGRIGDVSSIMSKAEAAKSIGATLFLVPLGQGTETTFETLSVCDRKAKIEICSLEPVPIKKDVENEVGIEIQEVATIREALEYIVENY